LSSFTIKSGSEAVLAFPIFLKEIEKYDLVFLAETHVGYNTDIHTIGPFHYHGICRSISKKNNRHFGGLAILRKNEIKPYVRILKNTSPEFQWVKLERDFFGFSDDLYICLVYYPPMKRANGVNICIVSDMCFCQENKIIFFYLFQKNGVRCFVIVLGL
jgi:hypothetical protein